MNFLAESFLTDNAPLWAVGVAAIATPILGSPFVAWIFKLVMRRQDDNHTKEMSSLQFVQELSLKNQDLINKMHGEIAVLRDENETLREKLQELQGELNKMKSREAQLERENAILRAKIDNCQTNCPQSQPQI